MYSSIKGADTMKLGIIGIGNIGGIFTVRFSQELKGENGHEIWIFDTNREKADSLCQVYAEKNKELEYVHISSSPVELCSRAEIIFLAVKPQDAFVLFEQIKEVDFSSKTILSTMAAITLETLENALVTRNIVRIMPNVPISIGKGVIGMTTLSTLSEEKNKEILRLLEGLGLVVDIKEKDFAALTALSGSSPAFVFVIVETLIDSGLMMGLSYDVSKKLVLGTLEGSARLLQEQDDLHPAVMKNKVTSPGGTTIEGIYQLEREGLRGILMKIMLETFNKAQKMSLSAGGDENVHGKSR